MASGRAHGSRPLETAVFRLAEGVRAGPTPSPSWSDPLAELVRPPKTIHFLTTSYRQNPYYAACSAQKGGQKLGHSRGTPDPRDEGSEKGLEGENR